MKTYSDRELLSLAAVGDGTYLYRWDIVYDETSADGLQWSAEEVVVPTPLSANGIIEAVISETWPSNREQKLVNEYNAAVLGISNGEEAERAKEAYSTFLRERAELKAQVERDCEMLNIK
jgi:hypothetical protein